MMSATATVVNKPIIGNCRRARWDPDRCCMEVRGIIARTLFHVTSGAVEETGVLRFGLVLEPRFCLLLVHGALQFRRDPLEVSACFFVVAETAPSIGQADEQFTSRVHTQLGKSR